MGADKDDGRWVFASPPGWPTPPENWSPPPGWRPDPRWPDAPSGWVFWRRERPSRLRRTFTSPYFQIVSIVTSVVLLIVGTVVTYHLADTQAVNSHRAVEFADDQQDAHSDDVRVSPTIEVYSGLSEVFDHPISLDEARTVQPVPDHPDAGAVRVDYAYAPGSSTATTQTFKFTLIGNHNAPVQVTSISARVLAARPPASGAVVLFVGQGVSNQGGIGFDLDSPNKNARTLDLVDHPTATNFLDANQVNLQKDEPLQFRAVVLAGAAEYDYVLDVQFVDGTRQTITDNGDPWRITAMSPTFQTAYFSVPTDSGGFTTRPCTWPACNG